MVDVGNGSRAADRRVVEVLRDTSARPGGAVTTTLRQHEVIVLVGGKQIRDWVSYAITSSMLDPVDTFQMTLAWSRKAWDLVKPDTEVKIAIDGVVVLVGFIDDRESAGGEDTITIVGRDRCGRLVDESSPGIAWRGLKLTQLIAKLVYPWFVKVTLSNARNRNLIRGKGRKAKVGSEPVTIDPRKDGLIGEPGQTRWAIVEELLKQAGMIAWSAGDGTELIVGRPNYDQEPQWRFFRPMPGSRRMDEGNVGITLKDSTGDRYSRVIVVGAGAGTAANYGASVVSRYGEARDNPATAEGTGLDFTAPKRLVIQQPASSPDEARALARQEKRRRDMRAQTIQVQAPAHGQLVGGTRATLFCPDTLAYVEDERTGRRGTYLVTACRYESDRDGGERTTLDLVPKGTELAT